MITGYCALGDKSHTLCRGGWLREGELVRCECPKHPAELDENLLNEISVCWPGTQRKRKSRAVVDTPLPDHDTMILPTNDEGTSDEDQDEDTASAGREPGHDEG